MKPIVNFFLFIYSYYLFTVGAKSVALKWSGGQFKFLGHILHICDVNAFVCKQHCTKDMCVDPLCSVKYISSAFQQFYLKVFSTFHILS